MSPISPVLLAKAPVPETSNVAPALAVNVPDEGPKATAGLYSAATVRVPSPTAAA